MIALFATLIIAVLVAAILLASIVTVHGRLRAGGARKARGARSAGEPSAADARLVLDTSAVIDGRALDWLEISQDPRSAVAPSCVRQEIAHLVGSSDVERQRRGALGLEHLRRVDELATSHGTDATEIPDVVAAPFEMHQAGGADATLLEVLANAPFSTLVTLDVELARRAREIGARVIEIHELAARLAQRYRVGDELEVLISTRGRREQQGVGTLDDGTRVMVDGASDDVGRKLLVQVSSFSRTAGGFVLFAHPSKSQE